MSYKNRQKKKNNSPQIHWGRNFAILAALICLVGAVSYFSLNIYDYGRAYGNAVLQGVEGYSVNEGNYAVSDGQEHYLSFSVAEPSIRGLNLYFGAPVGVDLPVTAHFCYAGEEKKTIQTTIPASESYIALLCGNRQIDTVLISIDGNFSLSSAVTEYIYETTDGKNNRLLQWIFILGVLLLLLAAWIARLPRTELLLAGILGRWQAGWAGLLKDRKAAAAFLCSLLAGILGGSLLWFCLARLFLPGVWDFDRNNLLFGVMLGLLGLTVFYYIRGRVKFEKMFLVFGLAMSFVLTVILPVHLNLSWDDQIHYNNSVCISHMGKSSAALSEADYYQSCFYPLLKQYGNGDRAELAKILNDPAANRASADMDLGFAFTKGSIVYFPVGLALFVCRGIGLPMNICVLLGRMASAWFFFFMAYFGMKHLKSGKMVMAAASFVPVCLYVISNYNYDYWMLGGIGYSIAYLIGEYQTPDKKLEIKDLVLIYLPFILGIIAKPVYIPLLGLAAFLPKKKFQNEKFCRGYRIFFLGVVVCAVIGFAVLLFGGGLGMGDLRGGAEVNAPMQIKYILANPAVYAGTLFRFLKTYLSLDSLTFNLVDTAYIPVKTWLGLPVLIWLILVCVVDRDREENQQIAWYVKAAFLPLAFVAVCFVVSAMYIMYTPVGADTVAGCSGRYLLPIVFPLMIVLSRIRFLTIPQPEKIRKWVGGIVMAVSVVPAIIMMTAFV